MDTPQPQPQPQPQPGTDSKTESENKALKTVQTAIKVPFSCAPLLFAIIGLFMFPSGLISLASHARLLVSGVRTTGTIVTNTGSNNTSPTINNPTVEFTTDKNQVIRYQINFSTDMVKYPVGSKIGIIYTENNPHDAVIDDSSQLWILPLILMIVGGIFLAISGINLYKMWIPPNNVQDTERHFNARQLKDHSVDTFIFFAVFGIVFLVAGIVVVGNQYQIYLSQNPGGKDFLTSYQGRYLFFMAFGLIFTGIGAGGIIARINKKNKNKKLMATGKKISATVSGYEYTNTRINRIPGCKILVKYVGDGASIILKSSPLYKRDIENLILKGDMVDVYVDPSKPQNYFIDINNLRPDKQPEDSKN